VSERYFLKSKRIGFRTWSLDDIEQAIQLWSDAEVTRYLGGPFSNSHIHGQLLTERAILRQHNIQCWPIFLLETNEFIGCCGLRPYMPAERVYELSFQIIPAFRGNGYAYEAARAVIEYAYTQLQATSIFAGHHPQNIITKALIEKLGFWYVYDEYYEPTGMYHPSYLLVKSV